MDIVICEHCSVMAGTNIEHDGRCESLSQELYIAIVGGSNA